jgi:hypothetical protein
MAIQTIAELQTRAQIIRNETASGANTAVRIGSLIDDFTESLDTITGNLWEFTLDGTYVDQPSALACPAGVRTKITVDGTAAHIHSPNTNGQHIWNTVNSKFEPLAVNDFYMMRFAITGESDLAAVNRFEVEFDVGGLTPIIGAETGVFAKGSGNPQSFNFSTGFFAGGDFVTNGGEIYITAEADASFWEIAITVSRTYTPIV